MGHIKMFGLFARELIHEGIPVIPVNPNTYDPDIKDFEIYAKNKVPLGLFDVWAKKSNKSGIGVVVGEASQICGIGFNNKTQMDVFIKHYLKTDPKCVVYNTDNEYTIIFHFDNVVGYGERIGEIILPNQEKLYVKIYGIGSFIIIPPSIMENNTVFYNYADNVHANNFKKRDFLYFPKQVVEDMQNTACLSDEKKIKAKLEIPHLNELTFKDEKVETEMKFLINSMLKGGVAYHVIKQVLRNSYPTHVELIEQLIASFENTKVKATSMADIVKAYVNTTTGAFSIKDCFEYLKSVNPNATRDFVRITLNRLCKDKVVVRYGDKDGWFIKNNVECNKIEWQTADIKPVNVRLPLELNRYVNIYPKNIIIVAGEPNSGKTAFCLNTAKLNIHTRYRIRYFSSEMGATELKLRLMKFNDVSIEEWEKVEFYERSIDFAPLIDPNGINIIDYMELSDAFYKIAEYTREIYEVLDKGICIIAIQKDKKSETGRGGSFGLEKPRLYLNMGRTEKGENYIKIVKAKCWANDMINPNGLVLTYKIIQGSSYVILNKWHTEEK